MGSDPPLKEAILRREGASHCTGTLSSSCTITVEPVDMPSGLWIRVGPMNHDHVLDGVQILSLEAAILRGKGRPIAKYMYMEHLWSAGCRQLLVPRHRRSMFGRRAFSVAGPTAWNSLPDYLRNPTRSVDSFRRDLKTFLFSLY